jgi:hypothetical protein
MSSRSILNFEAVLVRIGYDTEGVEKAEVQLFLNHHMVMRWPVPTDEFHRLACDAWNLDGFVASKFRELFYG